MISIIIPSYNQQEYLPDAIDSVLSQTNPNWELIIVDDGSTDNSLQIALNYAKDTPKIKVISQVNKGLASARNTGIMNSASFNTTYCLFLDADDVLLENCLEEIEKAGTQSSPYVEWTQPDIIGLSFREFGMGNREVILGQDLTVEDFKIANRIGYCSAVRRSALLEVGGYNPKMVWGAEDYDLWFDLLKRGKKLVTIPKVLWLYRIKESSMWTETQKHYEAFMKQIATNHPEVWGKVE